MGADYVKTQNHPNIKCHGLQSFELFPEVLASADVLIALIEDEAGEFSVPSKILSYMCAGKPIVISAPMNNLASKLISEGDCGLVANSADVDQFVNNCLNLQDDATLLKKYSINSRTYAENNFRIEYITDKFESIFMSL